MFRSSRIKNLLFCVAWVVWGQYCNSLARFLKAKFQGNSIMILCTVTYWYPLAKQWTRSADDLPFAESPALCPQMAANTKHGAFFGPGEDILSEIWLGQAANLSVFLIKDLCLYHAFVNLWSSNPARILQLYIPAWYSRMMPSVTHYDVCKFNKPCASQQGSSQ